MVPKNESRTGVIYLVIFLSLWLGTEVLVLLVDRLATGIRVGYIIVDLGVGIYLAGYQF